MSPDSNKGLLSEMVVTKSVEKLPMLHEERSRFQLGTYPRGSGRKGSRQGLYVEGSRC